MRQFIQDEPRLSWAKSGKLWLEQIKVAKLGQQLLRLGKIRFTADIRNSLLNIAQAYADREKEKKKSIPAYRHRPRTHVYQLALITYLINWPERNSLRI